MKYQNQISNRHYFNLFVAFLSILLTLAQTVAANQPLDFSVHKFSTENLLNYTAFSPQAVLVVNTAGDQNDQLPGDGFCNDGAGNCSLRAAIQEANAFAGAQTIDFNLPGSCGGSSILLNSPLPDITDSVTINGYSNPGALTNTAQIGDNANLCVLVDGSSAGSNADGLVIAAVNTTIRGLVILNFGDAGIEVNAAGGIVEGNFIGTNRSGTGFFPNRIGISVSANNSRIGGATLPARNIISANTRFGIALNPAGGSGTIQNNYIGLDSNSAALGNGESGINVFRSSGNLIGGANANAHNVISANGRTATGGLDGSGISIFGDTQFNQSPNNTISGNYIGTNPAGTSALANKTNGILINGAINTTVSGNVISGNTTDGIGITGTGATNNVVKSNIIGLDAGGINALGNGQDGVSIYAIPGNTVGGTGANDGNRIGSNVRFGVLISGPGAENNSIAGNFVGFNVNNESRSQNTGIAIYSNNNTVGGAAAGARNYVAGNGNFGISVTSVSGNTISGNYVGLTNTGAVLQNFNGIYIQDATNNVIGGTAAGAGNVVSGNQIGIRLIRTNQNSATTGNQILGNLVGTNPNGTTAIPNVIQGIVLQAADSNIIGGTTANVRNIISGNTGDGLSLQNDSKNNQVTGNYIGTTADGTTALANGVGAKIDGSGSTGNVIGGTATGAGNVISGNTNSGVRLQSQANNNRVEGNIVGLKADGAAALPNANGVLLLGISNNNVIAANTVSGNTNDGITITDGANANRVEGNKIGTDATGMAALPNSGTGIVILQDVNQNTVNNIIGGTAAAARNIISANLDGGAAVRGGTTTGNQISGNYVGIKADGSSALGNGVFGIAVSAPNNTIGGATAAHRNIISGQSGITSMGINLSGAAANTLIQNNYIGTTADGSGSLPNYFGIYCGTISNFTFDSNLISGNTVGVSFDTVNGGKIINNVFGLNAAQNTALGNGTAISIYAGRNIQIGDDNGSPAPNIIANSLLNGIEIYQTVSKGNTIRHNSIYNSGQLGIDLMGDGVTQNDAQDADDGPNHLQNFPVINIATTTISGSLNSTSNRTFRLEFFSSPAANASGYGEGRTFLTDQTVSTDASGNAVFSVSNPQPLGSYISATATDLTTNETSEFSAYKQTLAPTAVSFNGARATTFENGILVEWQTGRESDNLGFNVYREQNGKRELITKNIIAGSALTASENLLSEQNYSWLDANGDQNSTYFIESVDVRGAKEIYGAFRAGTSAKSGKNNVADSMTLNQLGSTETNSTITVEPSVELNAKPPAEQTKVQNALATNKTVKLTVRRAGIYRVTAEQLTANGLPANVNAANLQLFADGIEQPINIINAESGIFDKESAVEFYGTGTNTTETDARVYYLVASQNVGLRMSKTDVQGQPANAIFYNATVERRDRTIYFSGLLNGDDDNFFGATITNAGTNQTINAAHLANNGSTAELEISLQGVTRSQHSISVELNGSVVSQVNFAETERGTARIALQSTQLRDGENTVRLIANNQGDVSLVDYLRLTYPHLYRAENNTLNLTANGGQEITVGNFTSRNVRVFDVTNSNNPIELVARVQKSVSNGVDTAENNSTDLSVRNYAVEFTPTGSGTRSLLAIADEQLTLPTDVSFDNPSNLRDRRNAADLVIVTRSEFFDALRPLVKLRTKQGLIVNTVDVSDIYDEFSFGRKSSAAIKDFLNYTQTNWRRRPQFVLFGGDATYDPKGYLGNLEADVVQTKLVDTESIETASDEWLTDFDNDGVGEMAIGRLPARNTDEMSTIVQKIVNYERQSPSNSAAFVADTNDGYDFAAANRSIFSLLPQTIQITAVQRENADAKSRLMNAVADGQSIVSYSGHGSSGIWRGNLLTNDDAALMTNGDRLPLFVMMTCLNGYFQNPAADSLSETLLKNPNGGAVAVWASSGTTTPDSQTELNRQFIQLLYGQNLTIGQAVRAAKMNVANTTIRRTWTLFGDPAMRLK